MKFTRERTTSNTVRDYSAGRVRIRETQYTRSLIVGSDFIVTDWQHPAIEELGTVHLEAALEQRPDVVVVGCGDRQRFAPPPLLAEFAARGIGLEVMTTEAACRTYNVLVQEGRPAIAALMLEPGRAG